jgi:hypothetical protein
MGFYISYAEAFEFLEVRAEANHSEHDQRHHDHIRAWLDEIGFSQRYPRADFKRLSILFPSSVPRGMVINVYHRIPWSPPEQLTIDVLREYRNEPRISISTVANLMAFGRSTSPEDMKPIVIAARRQQAIAALFDAPARKGLVRLVGSPDIEGGDRSDDIPPSYFDMPRNLGRADNSIYTDLPRISEACEGPDANWDAARARRAQGPSRLRSRHQPWFNVRAVGPSCISWLEGCIVSFDPTLWWSKRCAQVWVCTRDRRLVDTISYNSDLRLDLMLADAQRDGKLVHGFANPEEAKIALFDKEADGSVRTRRGEYYIEDVLAVFKSGEPKPKVEQLLPARAKSLPIVPEGDGSMPVSAALHWIASEGFKIDLDDCPDAHDRYQAAAGRFSATANSKKFDIVGLDRDRKAAILPSYVFAVVKWPFVNDDEGLFGAGEARIELVPWDDDQRSNDEFWEGGESSPRVTTLTVLKESIRRNWPFAILADNTSITEAGQPSVVAGPLPSSPPTIEGPAPAHRQATKPEILAVLRQVCDALPAGEYHPNVIELPKEIQNILQAQGLTSSQLSIRNLAEDKTSFNWKRRDSGVRKDCARGSRREIGPSDD